MIYVMGARSRDIVKIGRSVDPWKRINSVQTGHPEPLTVLLALPGDHAEERDLHAYFADRRVSEREWFNFAGRNAVAEVAAAWFYVTGTSIPERASAPHRECTCDHRTPANAHCAATIRPRSVIVLDGDKPAATAELHRWERADDGCWVGWVRMSKGGAWRTADSAALLPVP